MEKVTNKASEKFLFVGIHIRREHRLRCSRLMFIPTCPFRVVLSTRQTPVVLPRSRKMPVFLGTGHGPEYAISFPACYL